VSEFKGLQPSVEDPALDAISAGEFSEWLQTAQPAVTHNLASDVPCGQCNACCRASYFIHVAPQDVAAKAVIPSELLFAAPGAPPGHQIMGFDEQGQCPMLKNDQCSIYAARPSTCRSYDCRVFAAADIAAGGAEKADVNARVLRWQFSHADIQARLAHAAVQKVAQVVKDCAEVFSAQTEFDSQAASPIARFAIEHHQQMLQLHEQVESTGRTLADAELAQRLLDS
jgi:Fe-S-cluster containining protein